MKVNLCDACGKTYKQYYKLDNFGEGNAMTIVKIEKDGQMKRKLKLDLCPTCMSDVWDYLKTGLVQDEGPAFKRINQDRPTIKEIVDDIGSPENDEPTDNPDYRVY